MTVPFVLWPTQKDNDGMIYCASKRANHTSFIMTLGRFARDHNVFSLNWPNQLAMGESTLYSSGPQTFHLCGPKATAAVVEGKRGWIHVHMCCLYKWSLHARPVSQWAVAWHRTVERDLGSSALQSLGTSTITVVFSLREIANWVFPPTVYTGTLRKLTDLSDSKPATLFLCA